MSAGGNNLAGGILRLGALWRRGMDAGRNRYREAGAVKRAAAWLLLVLLVPLGAACSGLGYYAQAIGGHLEMLQLARPLDDVLNDPATSSAMRARLERAKTIREFASRELSLPDNRSYRRYADVRRQFVVWNVIATPEFAVRPVESCFPIAGCVTYRGWYSEADARADAASQRREGRDVHVGGGPAGAGGGGVDGPGVDTFVG